MIEFFIKLHQRGQITIPKKIRKLLNVASGTILSIQVKDEQIIIEPKLRKPITQMNMEQLQNKTEKPGFINEEQKENIIS